MAVPGALQNVVITALTNSSLRVTWEAPTTGGTPTGYYVAARPSGESLNVFEQSYSASTFSADITGLAAGIYSIFAAANNGDGFGPVDIQTVTVGATAVPGVPTGVSLSQISGDSDSLRSAWNAVTGATSYQGQYKKTSDSGWTPISGDISSPHQIDGLDADTSHDFRVRATNSGGSSNYSSSDSATTDAVTDLMPTAPNISNQSATVGTPYSQTLAAGSGGDTPLTYAASPLPAGLSFNSSTRVISGTPTTAGSTNVTYTVTDDDGDTDTDTFVITVAAAPVDPDPIGWSSPTRLDSIADLDTIFDRADTGSSGGAWTLDTAGSTTSGNTGPGTNSGAPYVYSETSSGSFSTIPVKSTLTVKPTVMTAWTGADRQMLLRAAIQGAFSATEGLEVEGRALASDDWTRIELLEGWAYSSSYVSGGTVTDAAGDTQTFSQTGGWIDFAVTIPDAYTQVRIHTLAISGGNVYEHDIALWRIELLDGTAVAALGAPTNLSVSGDKNSRSLTWFAPAEDGGSAIIGYTIARQAPGESTGTVYVSNTGSTNTNYTDNETATTDGTYFYWVAAITALEPNGTYSSPASVIVSLLTAPPIPTGLAASVTAISDSAATITATWDASSGATKYELQVWDDANQVWVPLSASITATTYAYTGGSHGRAYNFTVRAGNDNGQWSDWASNVPIVIPMASPTVTAVDDDRIGVAWTAPLLSPAAASGISYDVRHRETGAASWTTLTGQDSGVQIDDLDASTPYEAQVRIVYTDPAFGASAWSATGSAMTAAVTVPSNPTSVSVSGDADSRTITWGTPTSDGGSAITSYKIGWIPPGSSFSLIVENLSPSTRTWTHDTDLTTDGTYNYIVYAVNSEGDSSGANDTISITTTAVTVPSNPTSVSVSGDADSRTITWGTPTSDGGSAITSYKIGWIPPGSSFSLIVENLSPSTRTWTHDTDLTTDGTYNYIVYAVNSEGDSSGANDTISITTTAVTVPSNPTSVSVSGDADSRTITWGTPTSDGGSAITSYKIGWIPPGSSFSLIVENLSPSTRTWTHDTDLTTDGTYTYGVYAVNDEGDSPAGDDTFQLTAVPDLMPTAPGISNQSATVGTPYSQTLAAGSGGDTPLSYTASPLPAGLSFNTSTRVISGTPTSAGSTTVTYTVTDDDGDSDTDTFGITVAPAGGPPAIGWINPTRLDSIADLLTIFDRADTGSTDGAWTLDTAGSTTSGNTGPGTNSGAPYVYSETSSGSFSTIPVKSTLTVKPTVMTAWTGADRQMLLRAAIQGAFSATEGLEVEGRALASDDWTRIELLEGWAYSNSYVSGGTVTDAAGDTQTFSQTGGWIDFAVLIPDAYTQVRIHTLAISGGAIHQHDIALWRIELLDGGATVTAPGVPTAVSLSAVDEDTLQLTWSAPTTGDAPTSYQAQYREGTSGPWIDISGDVTSPHDIDGLDPDTLYQAQVRATNSADSSAYSSPDSATTAAAVTPVTPTAAPVAAPDVLDQPPIVAPIDAYAALGGGLQATVNAFRHILQGGAESAEIAVAGPLHGLLSLLGRIRHPVRLTARRAGTVWSGYVHRVEVETGAMRVAASVDGMRTALAVEYPWPENEAITLRSDVLPVEPQASHFGRIVHLASAMSEEQNQDAGFLAGLTEDFLDPSKAITQSRDGAVGATLFCRGWATALGTTLAPRYAAPSRTEQAPQDVGSGSHARTYMGRTTSTREVALWLPVTTAVDYDLYAASVRVWIAAKPAGYSGVWQAGLSADRSAPAHVVDMDLGNVAESGFNGVPSGGVQLKEMDFSEHPVLMTGSGVWLHLQTPAGESDGRLRKRAVSAGGAGDGSAAVPARHGRIGGVD